MKAGFIKIGLIKPITFTEQAQRHKGYEKSVGRNENNSYFSRSSHKDFFTWRA